MNLVAKEYCASRVGQDGVLILSQFAGAAEQLKPDALLVNPYDIEKMADAILKAFRMSEAERSARMKRMRRNVRKENVFWWVDSFLKAGAKLVTRSTGLLNRRAARHKKTPNADKSRAGGEPAFAKLRRGKHPTSNAQRM